MKHPQNTKRRVAGFYALMLIFSGFLVFVAPLRAAPSLDTSSPIGFFTNTANLFLKTSGYPFTVSNIPIYPTNCYTPALHRLLQLAANIYDATTNRTFDDGTSPNGPYYPSVFRPTFSVDANTNVFISGYVEDVPNPTNPAWAITPLSLSLPSDLARMMAEGPPVNIYGIPYVIGARKGFPNFNQLALQSIVQVTRALEITKPYPSALPGTWQTNLLYSIGISNALGIGAWNSYSNFYPRGVQFFASIDWDMSLSDDFGTLYTTNAVSASPGMIASGMWPGFGLNPSNSVAFRIPLLTNALFLPQRYYHPSQSPRLNGSGVFDASQGPGFLMPHFYVTTTNRLFFVMVDGATGRLIDYVTLDNANYNRDLSFELNYSGLSAWSSNLVSPTYQIPAGVYSQITASMGMSYSPPTEYISAVLGGATALRAAEQAFEEFFLPSNTNTAIEAPLIAICTASDLLTWQVNDPLVHYNKSDLSATQSLTFSSVVTNPLPNLAALNPCYMPWGYNRGSIFGGMTAYNMALKDPLITQSDAWNFPSGQPLSLQMLGGVHRGTPWQTVYLKSVAINLGTWMEWTGNTNIQDAALFQPTNDWALMAALAPLLNTQSPQQLLSINDANTNDWSATLEGMTVLTNTSSGLEPLTIDENADTNAIAQIVAGINSTRATMPGQYFTSVGQILSVPQLSLASPFLNTGANTSFLNDAAYESIPSQLLALLRPDSIGSMVNTSGAPQIQFTGVDGWSYTVQASSDLCNWTTLGTQQTTNGVFLFSDPAGSNSPQRFYRTVLGP